MLPDATNKDVIDPKTFRLKQERRNTFVLTGNLEIYRNFGQSDTVKLKTISLMTSKWNNSVLFGDRSNLNTTNEPLLETISCFIRRQFQYVKLQR